MAPSIHTHRVSTRISPPSSVNERTAKIVRRVVVTKEELDVFSKLPSRVYDAMFQNRIIFQTMARYLPQMDWCNEKCEGAVAMVTIHSADFCVLAFEKEEDLVLFRCTFEGRKVSDLIAENLIVEKPFDF